jgi:hypothetical protein
LVTERTSFLGFRVYVDDSVAHERQRGEALLPMRGWRTELGVSEPGLGWSWLFLREEG